MFLDNNTIKMINNNKNFETIIVKIINIHLKKYKLDSRVKREICIELLHRIDISKNIHSEIETLLESNSDLQEMIYKEFYLTDNMQRDNCCNIM